MTEQIEKQMPMDSLEDLLAEMIKLKSDQAEIQVNFKGRILTVTLIIEDIKNENETTAIDIGTAGISIN